MRKTWTWPCFHPANSTARGNLGLESLPCGAVGCVGARSRSLHLQPAAVVWTSPSDAAHFLFQCWATRLHPTCRPGWHPQRSASACCPGCRTPCSMGALCRADRSFGLETAVSIRATTRWSMHGVLFSGDFLWHPRGRKIIYTSHTIMDKLGTRIFCQSLPTFSCNVGTVNHMVVKL